VSVALIDAGPLVALWDKASPAHGRYHRLLLDAGPVLRLFTTWPCIAEAAHFLSAPRRWAMLSWIADGGVTVFPFDAAHLADMVPSMKRYTELPCTDMDLADASLYWLAADANVTRVLTIDIRDFSRYRLPNGSSFELL
jgi:uncharacterized protein